MAVYVGGYKLHDPPMLASFGCRKNAARVTAFRDLVGWVGRATLWTGTRAGATLTTWGATVWR